jgi:chaperonin cofactor prefoldin
MERNYNLSAAINLAGQAMEELETIPHDEKIFYFHG